MKCLQESRKKEEAIEFGLGYVRLPISINQLFFGNIFGNKCRRRKIKYAPDGAKFAPPCEYFFLTLFILDFFKYVINL